MNIAKKQATTPSSADTKPKSRLKTCTKVCLIILLALLPSIWAIAVHKIALLNDMPYNKSCCALTLPDPSEFTVNYFLAVEVVGSLSSLAYTIATSVIFYRKFRKAQKENSKMSTIYLLALLLSFGQVILALCWAIVFLYCPIDDRYLRSYIQPIYWWENTTPIYFKMGFESDITLYIILPVSLFVSLIYHLTIKHRKTLKSPENKTSGDKTPKA